MDAYSSSQPAWFPDGSRILFRASGGPYTVAPIFSMPPEPGAAKQLVLQRGVPLWYPTLSPDMSKLLVASQYGLVNRGEDRGIEVALGTGPASWAQPFKGPLTTLSDGPKTAHGVYDSAGAWSPDGTQSAFESDVDGDMDLSAREMCSAAGATTRTPWSGSFSRALSGRRSRQGADRPNGRQRDP